MQRNYTDTQVSLEDLNNAVSSGIISPEAAQAIMRLRREAILKQYPQTQGTDGTWHAVIRFAPGKDGRKVLRRKELADLQDDIVNFIDKLKNTDNKKKSQLKGIEFYPYHDAFERWLAEQNYKNTNTEARNRREYRRFFDKLQQGRKIAVMDIREIIASDIQRVMSEAIREYNLTTRKSGEDYNMFFKAVFTQAIADRVISPEQNPCLFVLQNRFMQYSATEGNKPDEERIILPATEKIIAEAIRKDHEKDESYMPAYAAELSALTAMRSGELAGLWWKNIDFENGVLNIVQSQKHDETKKIYYISEVKNKKPRQIPMTDDIRELLLRIRSVQEKYGKSGDYVFSTKDGFNNVKQISDYMQNKKVQYKIQQPISIHAQRRTINSRMASQGVADVVRASILGHTTRVNLNNYTNDMTSMYEKQKVLASVGQIC